MKADSLNMDPQTKVALLCLIALGLCFVTGVLRVIGTWYEHHVARHDLVVASKQRRYDYLKAVAERDRAIMAMEEEAMTDSIIIEDDEPALAQAA